MPDVIIVIGAVAILIELMILIGACYLLCKQQISLYRNEAR
jgi:hypothetical protein